MELFDICDEAGRPTGQTVSREEAHRLGVRHRTAHVWIARRHAGRLQVLLQRRSPDKDSFPDQWDTSSAGHIPAGDEPLESALRELREELGLTAAPEALRFIGTFDVRFERQFHGAWFRDNELAHVFLYPGPVDTAALTLQAEEVSAVDWFDLERVVAACTVREDWCCVPSAGILLLADFLAAHPDAVR